MNFQLIQFPIDLNARFDVSSRIVALENEAIPLAFPDQFADAQEGVRAIFALILISKLSMSGAGQNGDILYRRTFEGRSHPQFFRAV